MKTKIYHENLNRKDVAQALGSFFNRGPLLTQLISNGHKSFVPIGTRQHQMVSGKTSLNIALSQVGDRLEVRVGEQSLLGLAASLAKSAWLVVRNPLNLLGRLDDIAQDIENLELDDQVWHVIDQLADNAEASHELSDRLRRLSCEYCAVANPVGEGRCIAYEGPLGDVQPDTCINLWLRALRAR